MRSVNNLYYVPNARTPRDWQRAIVDQLAVLDKVCRENDINYYICFGGLIGAVRHKGIIPWDNDVDVVMYEEDYLKLREVAAQGKLPEGYGLIDMKLEKDYPLIFSRFSNFRTSCPFSTTPLGGHHGVSVDVFTLFPLPDDPELRVKAKTEFLVWEELLCWMKRRSKYRSQAFVDRWKEVQQIVQEKGREEALRIVEESFRSMIPSKDSEWCFHSSGGKYEGFANFKNEWFADPIYLEVEGVRLAAPRQTRRALDQFYGGGWREFPPGEKFKAYSASNFFIPWKVMSEDFEPAIEPEPLTTAYFDYKEKLMEETVLLRETEAVEWSMKAEPLARWAESILSFDQRMELEVAADPMVIQAPEKKHRYIRKVSGYGVHFFDVQNLKDLKNWHIAVPFESKVMSGVLWSYYITHPDFWTVSRFISTQKGDPEHCTFTETTENKMLLETLELTKNLYFAMDDDDTAAISSALESLRQFCPDSVHTIIGDQYLMTGEYIRTGRGNVRQGLQMVEQLEHYMRVFGRSPYLQYCAACVCAVSGSMDEAVKRFSTIFTRTINGMIHQKAEAFCKEWHIEAQHRDMTMESVPAGIRESRPSLEIPALEWNNWTEEEAAAFKEKKDQLHQVQEEIKKVKKPVIEYQKQKRLTSDRISAWERTYPRKQVILKAAEKGDMATVRTFAKPYIDAVYRLFDRDHTGVFIDQEILDVCKPIFIEDRGEEFLNDYLQIIPERHKENIDAMLKRKQVPHPYIQ